MRSVIILLITVFLIDGADCLVVPENFRLHSKMEMEELISSYPKSNLTLNKGDPLEVKVSSFFSNKTKLHDSYFSLPFILPTSRGGEADHQDFNIQNSDIIYTFNMDEEGQPSCNHVAGRITLDATTAKELKDKIQDEYNVNMILNNHLPLILRPGGMLGQHYRLGYHLGYWGEYLETKEKSYAIYNHLSFNVKYRKDYQTGALTVSTFEVEPLSYDYDGEWNDESYSNRSCVSSPKSSFFEQQVVEEKKEILFTYSVSFEEEVYIFRRSGSGLCRIDPACSEFLRSQQDRFKRNFGATAEPLQ